MTKLLQLLATAAVAGLVGGAAVAEPTSNGLHLNGLHLNGLHLNGLDLNSMNLKNHWTDWPLGDALTFKGVVREAEGSRVPDSLRALAAAPLAND